MSKKYDSSMAKMEYLNALLLLLRKAETAISNITMVTP